MVVFEKNGRPLLGTNGSNVARFAEIYEWGTHLANAPVNVNDENPRGLWDATGWKELVEHMPAHKQPIAAILLENCRNKFGRLDEVTRTSNLGTFDKWIFPVISNLVENDVIDQLVAEQPMAGPVSQIVFLDIVTAQRKGQTPKGAAMWRALGGATDRDDDASEIVNGENGTLVGNATTLEWRPLRPGTLQVTVGNDTTTDDGNGALIASGVISGGTVNYETGAVTITGVSSTAAYSITYQYNSESNSSIMGYDVKISSTPVTAQVMKLKAVWSEEADQNLSAMYNIKAESILLNSITAALQYQKHRQVIMDLRARADAGFVEWDATPPANVNYQTHKYSFVDALETLSNFIFGSTNMVAGNWALLGLQPATIVATLPHFVPRNNRTEMQGVTYIGDLGNKKIFVDPHFPVNEFMVGHKGDQFLRTGYVLAEYQKLYTTPDIMLPDFNHQRGFATSFAKKCVNAKMYSRGVLASAPASFGGS